MESYYSDSESDLDVDTKEEFNELVSLMNNLRIHKQPEDGRSCKQSEPELDQISIGKKRSGLQINTEESEVVGFTHREREKRAKLKVKRKQGLNPAI